MDSGNPELCCRQRSNQRRDKTKAHAILIEIRETMLASMTSTLVDSLKEHSTTCDLSTQDKHAHLCTSWVTKVSVPINIIIIIIIISDCFADLIGDNDVRGCPIALLNVDLGLFSPDLEACVQCATSPLPCQLLKDCLAVYVFEDAQPSQKTWGNTAHLLFRPALGKCFVNCLPYTIVLTCGMLYNID